MEKTISHLVNHIVFVVDASGSMQRISNEVVKVFDNQIKYLSQRSQELNQETRVSVYLFNYSSRINCLIYDMDVMRLPSLAGYYRADGQTALLDATLKAIYDLGKTPELYGDHAFLIYTLTDGQENNSVARPDVLSKAINSLPENWTLAVLVPDQSGVFEAKKFGFPADNISVWDSTTSKGMAEVGNVIQQATDHFFTFRSQGIRSSRSLFRPNITATPSQVRRTLEEVNPISYRIFRVPRTSIIRDFVANQTGSYIPGSAFYQVVERKKPHKVQDYKAICIRDNRNGKLYTGDNVRLILGLPDSGEVKIKPGDFQDYDVFIQSTSYNRKLEKGSELVVMSYAVR